MTDFWQHFQLRLDPWGAEYEAPVGLEGEGATVEPVDATVEVAGPWSPLAVPGDLPLPDVLLFIDGRRRLDARLVGRDGDGPLYGAFATIAVGAVRVDRRARLATCVVPPVRRVLAMGGNRKPGAAEIRCPLGGPDLLRYDHVVVGEDNQPTTPLTLVQNAMLEEEKKLAMSLAAEGEALVIRDGPLRRIGPPSPMLGYVKTMQKSYLHGAHAGVLWQLELNQRTPIFSLGEQDHRWSWYLRTGTPEEAELQRGYHGLHGVVRLELPGWVDLATARRLADQSARLIPLYASRGYRDPRAPQNLTPVGALERELGRRMGDPGVITRRVGRFLAPSV